MLNPVHFDPWQRSLFVPPVSSANTKEKGPLLAGKGSRKGTRAVDSGEEVVVKMDEEKLDISVI